MERSIKTLNELYKGKKAFDFVFMRLTKANGRQTIRT